MKERLKESVHWLIMLAAMTGCVLFNSLNPAYKWLYICGIVLLAAKALAILFDMNHRAVDIAFSAAIFFIGAVNLFFELHGSGSFRFLMAGLCLIMALLAGLDVFLKIRDTGKPASLR